jgi:hypothetical protein
MGVRLLWLRLQCVKGEQSKNYESLIGREFSEQRRTLQMLQPGPRFALDRMQSDFTTEFSLKEIFQERLSLGFVIRGASPLRKNRWRSSKSFPADQEKR